MKSYTNAILSHVMCNIFLLLLMLTASTHYTAASSHTYNTYVTFDMVSFDRIKQHKEAIDKLLKQQASTRKTTVIAVSLLTLAALGGGIAYWQHQAKSENTTPQQPAPSLQQAHDIYLAERAAYAEDMKTVSGIIKRGLKDGLGYAIAAVSTGAFLSLFNKLAAFPLNDALQALYPTLQSTTAQQEVQFKHYFDYLFATLQHLHREQAMIQTEEELATFLAWRGMLVADVQTSIATMVHAAEYFTAFAFGCMDQKMIATTDQTQLTALEQKFAIAAEKLHTFNTTLNELSWIIESGVNCMELHKLEQIKRQISPQFRNCLFTAQEAVRTFSALTEVL